MTNGMNSCIPDLYFEINLEGLVRPYHVSTRMAASTAMGIILRYADAKSMAVIRMIPWKMVDCLLLAPADRLTLLLTITDVIGSQPNMPEIILPVPCAISSRLRKVVLPLGSSLSIACIQRIVSMLATNAIVKANT